VLAALAIGLVALGTRQGPGISPDSVNYISGARNLAEGRGYVNYSDEAITVYPPGFPATLAVADALGADAASAARWLNALAFGALVVLTFVLARRHVRLLGFAIAAAAAVAFSQAGVHVASFAWSEPVFCILAVALILILEPITEQRARNLRLLAAAAGIASIGFLYRYAGVVLLALPALVIVIAASRDGLVAVAKRTAAYAGMAAIVPILVIVRNLANNAGPLGDRSPSSETVVHTFKTLVLGVSEWVVPNQIPSGMRVLALGIAVLLVVIGLGMAIRQGALTGTPTHAPALALLSFVAIYAAYLVLSEMTTNIDPIGSRLLAPILAPSVVLAAMGLEQLLLATRPSSRPWLAWSLGILAALWLVGFLAISARDSEKQGSEGGEMASSSFRQSRLAAEVRQLGDRSIVYSNRPDGLYWLIRRQPTYWVPRATAYRSEQSVNDLSEFEAALRTTNRTSYLAWFKEGGREYLFTPKQLRQRGLELQPVATVNDGVLFKIGPGN
jgi:hypothetical protein